MLQKTVEIKVYDKRAKLSTTIQMEQLSEHVFRTTENELFTDELTLGTEFETRLNKNGKHEIIRIIKKSDFVTRRFFLTSQFKESEYQLLGDEIMKQGGFWQVELGSVVTINLPKDSQLNIDEIFMTFDFNPTEITE